MLNVRGKRKVKTYKMNDTITKIQIKDCTLYHADCIDVFDEIGKVDVVITDPPYGIGLDKKVGGTGGFGTKSMKKPIFVKEYNGNWDQNKLDKKYIDLILANSVNQIIFGGNYYGNWLPASSCWLVWDKLNSGDFADCELIWTSFNTAVRKITFKWNGCIQQDMKNKEKRYHLTQKPQYVMRWIINKYTKETDLILDPFMGSGSTGVAAAIGGRKFIGIEKEKQYFDIACKRNKHTYINKQQVLF